MKAEWMKYFRGALAAFLVFLGIYYWETAASFFRMVFSSAAPLFVGCLAAYPLNLLMSFYERHCHAQHKKGKWKAIEKVRRPLCIAAALVTLLCVVGAVMLLVIPQMISCVQQLISRLPEITSELLSWLSRQEWLSHLTDWDKLLQDWQSKFSGFLDVLLSGAGSALGYLSGAISSVFSTTVTALVSLVFSLYILGGKERLSAQASRLLRQILGKAKFEKMLHVLKVLDKSFHHYLVGQCIEALILGSLCTLGMLIFRLPYATMVGALVSLTALIPVAGAWIGAGVGAFMIFTISPVKALIFLIFILVLQQLENNLIYPRVVGSSIGLPGIWVLFAITVGGGLLGVMGMLLSVPLVAAAYQLLGEWIRKKEAEETKPLEGEN